MPVDSHFCNAPSGFGDDGPAYAEAYAMLTRLMSLALLAPQLILIARALVIALH